MLSLDNRYAEGNVFDYHMCRRKSLVGWLGIETYTPR